MSHTKAGGIVKAVAEGDGIVYSTLTPGAYGTSRYASGDLGVGCSASLTLWGWTLEWTQEG